MPRPIDITFTPANTSVNNISLAQTTAGAGNFLLNGSTAGVLDLNRRISIASTGNISGVNFTITGIDVNGLAVTEIIAGPNNNTVTSVYYYKAITQIAVNGAVGTNTTVGTSNQFASAILPLNYYRRVPHTVDIECTGTITYTVQETFDDIQTETIIWQNVPSLTNVVVTSSVPNGVNQQGTLNCTACRVVSNSYTNGAVMHLRVIQSAGTDDD